MSLTTAMKQQESVDKFRDSFTETAYNPNLHLWVNILQSIVIVRGLYSRTKTYFRLSSQNFGPVSSLGSKQMSSRFKTRRI